jgi:MFS superfamily sulfate permease-like transporter
MMEFILGIVVGTMALWLLAVWTVHRYLDKIQQAVDARRQQDLIIRARVEQIDSQFYIYNIDKNEFLVQGRNMKELIDNLELRKPGAVIGVVDGDDQAIQNLKATAQ